MNWLIPVVIGAVVVGALLVFVLTRKKKEPSLAERLGLVDQGGILRGQIQGFTVTVETQIRGETRKHSRTVIKVGFPHRLGLGLKAAASMGGRRSLRALSTGDAGFDDSVTLEAQDKKKTLEFLTPERRQCLKKMPRVGTNGCVMQRFGLRTPKRRQPQKQSLQCCNQYHEVMLLFRSILIQTNLNGHR